MSLLFDLFFESLLFFFNLLPKQFTLSLQVIRLLGDLLKLVLMSQLPFGFLSIQQYDFGGQVFASPLGESLFFKFQLFINLAETVSIILSFAFGLNPQAITFSIQDCPFLTELHPIFIKLCPDRSLEDDSLFGESPLGRSKFDHLSLL